MNSHCSFIKQVFYGRWTFWNGLCWAWRARAIIVLRGFSEWCWESWYICPLLSYMIILIPPQCLMLSVLTGIHLLRPRETEGVAPGVVPGTYEEVAAPHHLCHSHRKGCNAKPYPCMDERCFRTSGVTTIRSLGMRWTCRSPHGSLQFPRETVAKLWCLLSLLWAPCLLLAHLEWNS